jgi:hypothetical protein
LVQLSARYGLCRQRSTRLAMRQNRQSLWSNMTTTRTPPRWRSGRARRCDRRVWVKGDLGLPMRRPVPIGLAAGNGQPLGGCRSGYALHPPGRDRCREERTRRIGKILRTTLPGHRDHVQQGGALVGPVLLSPTRALVQAYPGRSGARATLSTRHRSPAVPKRSPAAHRLPWSHMASCANRAAWRTLTRMRS